MVNLLPIKTVHDVAKGMKSQIPTDTFNSLYLYMGLFFRPLDFALAFFRLE